MKTQEKLPKSLLYRLEKIIPAGNLQSVFHSFAIKRPTTIRANTIKIPARDLRNLFFEKGIKLHNVPWYREGFIVQNRSLKELRQITLASGSCLESIPNFVSERSRYRQRKTSSLSRSLNRNSVGKPSFESPALSDHRQFQSFRDGINLYEGGYFYVQSLSSMIPPLVLDPQPNEKVLDMCASPGSKTTQMAAMMENKGEILANEINPIRLEKLKANLNIQGVTNTYTGSFPQELIGNKFTGFFDRTLVDAPCSGEGRINIFKPETYKGWNREKVRRYANLQKGILFNAVYATKPGGIIVYSTCTLSPEENEEVVDWILNRERGSIVVENIEQGTWNREQGITQWEGKSYDKQIAKTMRILPSATMEGFFVARIRKK